MNSRATACGKGRCIWRPFTTGRFHCATCVEIMPLAVPWWKTKNGGTYPALMTAIVTSDLVRMTRTETE